MHARKISNLESVLAVNWCVAKQSVLQKNDNIQGPKQRDFGPLARFLWWSPEPKGFFYLEPRQKR